MCVCGCECVCVCVCFVTTNLGFRATFCDAHETFPGDGQLLFLFKESVMFQKVIAHGMQICQM